MKRDGTHPVSFDSSHLSLVLLPGFIQFRAAPPSPFHTLEVLSCPYQITTRHIFVDNLPLEPGAVFLDAPLPYNPQLPDIRGRDITGSHDWAYER